MLQNKSNQGCTQASTCYKGPVDQVLLRAYTCVLQNDKTQHVTQGSTVTKVWPTTCCCGHTHVCCRINHRRVATRVKLYEGFSDQTLQGAYTCVLQNRRIQGSSQGSNPGSKVTKVWPTSFCCEHTCVFQTTSSTGGAGVRTHLARAHVSCRTNQSSVAPMDQGLQRFGRPNAAVSTHTHTCLLRHNGVADQLLL